MPLSPALTRPRFLARRGFSLVELLTVVVILGVLAAVAVPAFIGQRDSADDGAAQAEVSAVYKQARVYYTLNGESFGNGTALRSYLSAQLPDMTIASTTDGGTPSGSDVGVWADDQELYIAKNGGSGVQSIAADSSAVTRSWTTGGGGGGPAPTPTWSPTALSAGGASSDIGYSITALADGSALVTGSFAGTATFGSTSLTSAGNNDMFVAKVNADGTWAWAVRAGGTSNDVSYGISALTDGSALVTGSFEATTTFGGTSLTTAGSLDVFVAKVNADGTWAWASKAGGTSFDGGGRGISALADGSALVTGIFSGTATFGSTSLTFAGGNEVFVAKVNADGTWAWASKAGGTGHDYSQGITALTDGSALITGYFVGTATFGGTSLTSAGSDDVFVAKVNSDGTWAWATRGGSSGVLAAGRDEGYSITALSDGSALVTGRFNGTATFGSTSLTSAGSSDVFVAKVNADGTWAWASQAGGGTSDDYGYGITALTNGSALVTGYFAGTSTFGSTSLTTAGTVDVFVAKVNADGTWAWASQAGGAGGDFGRGITALSDGSALVTGNFNSTATFGSTSLTSAGSNDVFVAKVGATGTWGG